MRGGRAVAERAEDPVLMEKLRAMERLVVGQPKARPLGNPLCLSSRVGGQLERATVSFSHQPGTSAPPTSCAGVGRSGVRAKNETDASRMETHRGRELQILAEPLV